MAYKGNDFALRLLYFVNILSCVSSDFVKDNEENNLTETTDTGGKYEINMPVIQVTEFDKNTILTSKHTKLRAKRQSGGGKYTDAAQMPQVKVLRLFLQMLKNLWAPVYVGGAHPFHHEVPKPIVKLFRDKIVEFFFPQIGDDAKKT